MPPNIAYVKRLTNYKITHLFVEANSTFAGVKPNERATLFGNIVLGMAYQEFAQPLPLVMIQYGHTANLVLGLLLK